MVLTSRLWRGELPSVVCLASLAAAASDVVSRQSLDAGDEPPAHDPSMQIHHNSRLNSPFYCFNCCFIQSTFSKVKCYFVPRTLNLKAQIITITITLLTIQLTSILTQRKNKLNCKKVHTQQYEMD